MHIVMIRNAYFGGIGLVILAIVFLFMASEKRVWVDMEATDYNTALIEDVTTDIVLEGELYANYGAFVEEYQTKNGSKYSKSAYTYLVPIGNSEYIGVQVKDDKFMKEIENQTEETFSYLNYETSFEPQAIHIRGPVKRMDSQSYQYMKEYMLELGFTNGETEMYAYPYYIDTNYYKDWQFFFWGGVLCMVGGVGTLVVKIAVDSGRLKKKRTERETTLVSEEVPTPTSTFTPYEPSTSIDENDTYEDMNSYMYNWQNNNDTVIPEQKADDDKLGADKSSLPFRLNNDEFKS